MQAATLSGYFESSSSRRSLGDSGGVSPRMRLLGGGDQDGLTAVEPGRLAVGRAMDNPVRGDQSFPGVAATDRGLLGDNGDDARLENCDEELIADAIRRLWGNGRHL